MEDVKWAAKLGQSLGGETSQESLLCGGGFDVFGDGCLGSLILLPFVVLNPLFWFQWIYRSKAKRALAEGNLDLAQQHKSTSTKFAVFGWLVTILAIFVATSIFLGKFGR